MPYSVGSVKSSLSNQDLAAVIATMKKAPPTATHLLTKYGLMTGAFVLSSVATAGFGHLFAKLDRQAVQAAASDGYLTAKEFDEVVQGNRERLESLREITDRCVSTAVSLNKTYADVMSMPLPEAEDNYFFLSGKRVEAGSLEKRSAQLTMVRDPDRYGWDDREERDFVAAGPEVAYRPAKRLGPLEKDSDPSGNRDLDESAPTGADQEGEQEPDTSDVELVDIHCLRELEYLRRQSSTNQSEQDLPDNEWGRGDVPFHICDEYFEEEFQFCNCPEHAYTIIGVLGGLCGLFLLLLVHSLTQLRRTRTSQRRRRYGSYRPTFQPFTIGDEGDYGIAAASRGPHQQEMRNVASQLNWGCDPKVGPESCSVALFSPGSLADTNGTTGRGTGSRVYHPREPPAGLPMCCPEARATAGMC